MDENQKIVIQSQKAAEGVEEFFEFKDKFEELMMYYECAIQEVTTKFQVLNKEFSVRNQRNPIEYITFRVKKPLSILEKLNRKGLSITYESMQELNDIAGVRVICSFIDDIYMLANLLSRQDDIHVLEVKDYIKNPKPNGYRSYHMIVEVPVFFSDCTRMMRVEVQIRTIAMNFWASLEHQIHYKKFKEENEEIVEQLAKCANVIYETDVKMQQIREKLGEEGKVILE